jgi:hypothetical protein
MTACGIKMETETSKMLATSLDAAVRPEDPYYNKLIRIMATRCTISQYHRRCRAWSVLHYGLQPHLHPLHSPIQVCSLLLCIINLLLPENHMMYNLSDGNNGNQTSGLTKVSVALYGFSAR